MTQKKSERFSKHESPDQKRGGTRVRDAPPDLYDPDAPRIGRRESEPYSAEVTYLHDVLTTNFPDGRAVWDLHHYFIGTRGALKGEKIDIQFDISFFQNLKISHTLSSYKAYEHDDKVPDIAINVLSKSTWRNDIGENVDKCKNLEIPVYAVFSPYRMTSKLYHPPFLRVYLYQENDTYKEKELREITLEEGEELQKENIISLEDRLPFSLGLMRLKQKHERGKSLYRLILINPSTFEVYLTKFEKKIQEKDEEIEQLKKKLNQ